MIKTTQENEQTSKILPQFIFHVSRTTRCLLRHLIGAHKLIENVRLLEIFRAFAEEERNYKSLDLDHPQRMFRFALLFVRREEEELHDDVCFRLSRDFIIFRR